MFKDEAPALLAALGGPAGQAKVDAARQVHDRCGYGWRSLVVALAGVSDSTCDRWRDNGWRWGRAPRAEVPARTCAWAKCRQPFTPRKDCEPTQHCSRRCAALDRWNRDKEPLASRHCALESCRREFVPNPNSWPTPTFCSRACAGKARWAGRAPPPAEDGPAPPGRRAA